MKLKLICLLVVLTLITIGTASATITIEVYDGNNWQLFGEEQFEGESYPDYRYTTKMIALPFATTEVRLTQSGTDTAHLDGALLDGKAPLSAMDTTTDIELAPGKLAEADYDVIDAAGRTIEISWSNPGTCLVLTGVEEDLLGGPILWPQQGHLEYTLDESRSETFSEYLIPDSSHPAGTFYATFSTTPENLVVNLDATGDNTFDPGDDWAELLIVTPDGPEKFRISNTMTEWGTSTFEYTDKVSWEHKTCQFNIPLEEIGLSHGDVVQLQIRYYGTEAVEYSMQLVPDSADNPVGTSHTVIATVLSGGEFTPFSPAQGIDVTFNIISGPHAGTNGFDTTNSSGQATFTYAGTTNGTDVIEATIKPLLWNSQPYPTVTKEWINHLPVADANGPYTGNVGSSITLDGSGSFDIDGYIVSWEWDIDGDGGFDDGSGETVNWTWSSVGDEVVGLKVTDDLGKTDIDFAQVRISESGEIPIPEFPTIALPIVAILGLAFAFMRRKE